MRIFRIILVTALMAAPLPDQARAEITTILPAETAVAVADLRALIYKSDFAGVEAMLKAEHQTSLKSGQYERQRRVFNAFSVTDPRVHDFIDAYLTAYPNSPYAMIAHTWNVQAAGVRVRGGEWSRWTYPPALKIFNTSHAEALDYAWRAYELAPDLVAASDGVLRISGTTGWQRSIDEVIEEVMTLTPNRGSLTRAAEALDPKWGGSERQMAKLCALYATKITDVPDYDEETCLIDIVFNTPLYGQARDWAMQALDQNDNPVLEYARIEAAKHWAAGTDASRDVLARYLADPTTVDVEAAQVDAQYHAVPHNQPSMAPAMWDRRQDYAVAELEHDPYNPELLDLVFSRMSMEGAKKLKITAEQRLDARRRILLVTPYDPEAWRKYGSETTSYELKPETDLADHDIDAQADPFYINAIVYSNHRPLYLYQYAQDLDRDLRMVLYQNFSEDQHIMDLPESVEYTDALLCPMIRTTRVLTEICAQLDGTEGRCPDQPTLVRWTEINPLAEARNLCPRERTAPIEDLFYEPQVIDWTKQP